VDKFIVSGDATLHGPIAVSGSKNTALPLMTAAVLGSGVTTLRNVPALRDVYTYSNVLRVAGAHVEYDELVHTVRIDATRIGYPEAPYELVKQMRASFYMLGALLGRCGHARVSLPGGCAWGPRPVDLHLEGLKAFGANVELDEGYVVATTPRNGLPGGSFRLEPSSVGATVNLLLAAVTAHGPCRIENAAMEPDVVVFGEMLRAMGARIEGLGTTTLEVEGVDELKPVTFSNSHDRIELGTFMILAAMAGEPGTPFEVTNGDASLLGDAFTDAFRATGAGFTVDGSTITVTPPERIQPVSIETAVYPGFPTDLQQQWTVYMTQAEGPSVVRDNIYLDRFAHVPELVRMGAQLVVKGNACHVGGGQRRALQGTKVMSTDLRGSVALVMAGLVAHGDTHVLRVYHLDRGYEALEDRLIACGAGVEREAYDENVVPVEA
jgi:UDP-N-acetylglucosamine 1-carboxyvinyltransferase